MGRVEAFSLHPRAGCCFFLECSGTLRQFPGVFLFCVSGDFADSSIDAGRREVSGEVRGILDSVQGESAL